jgi:hypothetical protein
MRRPVLVVFGILAVGLVCALSAAWLLAVLSPPASDAVTQSAPPKPSFVEAGVSQNLYGPWVVTVSATPLELTHRIGSQWAGKDSDKGYVFVLIPLFVVNSGTETDTFGEFFWSWKLKDDLGYTYDEDPAGLYLDDSQTLDSSHIPPGATRSGTLVFQISAKARELYLSLVPLGGDPYGLPWHFSVNQGS